MKDTYILKLITITLFISGLYTGVQAQTSCGVDTVSYTYQKSTQFRGLSLNTATSGSSFAQWFPAPQPLTISGFDFYGWVSDNNNPTATVTLTCNLYRAGSDSLPTGFPLRSQTINIDSTFKGGVLTALRKTITFGSPQNLNFPYVLTVETSSSVNVSILSNDYAATTPNGRKEWFSSVKINGNYVRGYNVNVGNIPFDADFIFMPQVSYTLVSDFTFTGCNNVGNPIGFTNTTSPVFFSPVYNFYAFYNLAQFGCQWDYGDTTGIFQTLHGNHTYYKRLDYEVSLKDTIFGWRVGCSDTKKKTVIATPLPPKVSNDGPHCSGGPFKLFADSVPGGIYRWTGPNGYIDSVQYPVVDTSDASHTGAYSATVRRGNCTSGLASTALTIYPTPATPESFNDGPKCVGDSVTFGVKNPSASVFYSWYDPKGNPITTDPGFTISNLDTTYTGDYYVQAENSNCKSGFDTTTFYTYPPPVPPVVSTISSSTLCEGETLQLKATAPPGVNFIWNGPGNYSAAVGSPERKNAVPTYSGKYKAWVVVGSCISQPDSIDITVNPKPTASISIAGQPQFCDGDSSRINAGAAAGLSYKWIFNGSEITGALNDNIYAKSSGDYRVLVTNSFTCSDTSGPVSISVKPLPTFNVQPTAKVTGVGYDISFTAISPEAGVIYQWEEDAGSGFNPLNDVPPYSGVHTNTLTITNTTPVLTGRKYRCMATLGGCEQLSSEAALTINTGIHEILQGAEITLFPNPATSTVNLGFSPLSPISVKWAITDLTGRVFLTSPAVDIDKHFVDQVDVSTLSKGIYLVKIEAGHEHAVLRFIVE